MSDYMGSQEHIHSDLGDSHDSYSNSDISGDDQLSDGEDSSSVVSQSSFSLDTCSSDSDTNSMLFSSLHRHTHTHTHISLPPSLGTSPFIVCKLFSIQVVMVSLLNQKLMSLCMLEQLYQLKLHGVL